MLWWLLLGEKPNFFCGDEGTNGKACSELVQIRKEWVVGGKRGVEQSDFVEDEISKVAEGEDGLHLAVAQEEGDTDTLDKEVEWFIHVVNERDGDFKVRCNRREVGDVAKVFGAI
jgi:hypothetical protein